MEKASGAWEKVLSVLLTLNIAMMGWLWSNVARLAERLDRHFEDRAIHMGFDAAQFVGKGEWQASRESARAAESSLADRLARIEEKVDMMLVGRGSDGA
jgi:hypothetical protein